MENVGKKCGFDEEPTAGADTEDQQATIKGPPFQSQSPGFHEINRRDFITVAKQSFVSGK
jgi:hypothetical protein